MEKKYSFKKGLGKAAFYVLSGIALIVSMSGFADFTLWQLLETYLKPVLAGITVSGLIGLAVNYVKFKYFDTDVKNG